ncbi:MAG TPA: ABC transporter permease [Chloroflexus aurantiacus]|jgi:peptide/nickel transport system permease protein|uniref:Binding-protein-dependent transport systems inner membrane component n=1 Tax=Chloroflexus aurantiacus (strain ATCC 29366 / DSM 635 / J-10-fl) TaxID=324602 RepID=A9WKA7_CHLAA|nr:ABC transporter permease [Chloroflexus aurantiacus]ABY35985.1 binding-protein-dependent transport systems inner membrane component [Chloroflexus aurantiacus J-10-fl]RMG50068.1 MAG: ABC transporter permease [Chloroflexota bacterium]GIV91499.1 MAG: peptide ABC transporter permease [Chloroflexus sp.]HBW68029.1 ABC transporter permease [Chloroflexus aurantiacus]
MTTYLLRRLLQAVLTLFVVSLILFGLISVTPGGFMTVYAEKSDMTAADLARIRANLGLDDPVPIRYVKWLGNLLKGDWGRSLTSKRPVLEEIGSRLPNTLLLMSLMLICTLLVAIPLGILSAIRQYSWLDNVLTTIAFAGQSLPVFWFGLLLIIVFSVLLRGPDGKPLLPGSGMYTLGEPFSLWDRIRHLILPVTMLTFVSAAEYMRYMRSAMLDVIHEDYIRTARAKGIQEWVVIYKHALRNAIIPLVTLLSLDLPSLFAGALFTETIFAWPGIGRLYFTAALKNDYPLVMAILTIYSALIILSNLLVDLIYAMLDPRIRLS